MSAISVETERTTHTDTALQQLHRSSTLPVKPTEFSMEPKLTHAVATVVGDGVFEENGNNPPVIGHNFDTNVYQKGGRIMLNPVTVKKVAAVIALLLGLITLLGLLSNSRFFSPVGSSLVILLSIVVSWLFWTDAKAGKGKV